MKWIVLLAALAAGSANAQALPATPAQQARADELGAFDSPRAFLASCAFIVDKRAPEVQKAYERASKDEREQLDVIESMAAMFCMGVIRSVAETVHTAKEYRTDGGTRICVSENMEVAPFIRRLREVAKAEPKLLDAEGVTAATLVIYGLHKENACP